MSTQHGPVVIKPISEVAEFQRNLIPASIPVDYTLKPMFKNLKSEECIRNGVVAFKDFLLLFCDILASDGHLYAKAPKKPNSMADYPFLFNVTNLLVDIGYYSKLSKNGASLLIDKLPVCTASIDEKGKSKSPKISMSGQIECLKFLTLCGFEFSGIDFDAKTHNASNAQLSEVFYPDNPILLTGLKALSIADMELRTDRRYWNDNNLLRCDYRLLKADKSDMRDVLIDFLHPLPKSIREFSLRLHQRYTDMGLNCINTRLGLISLAYVFMGKSNKNLSERDIYSKRVWEFSYSLRHGYSIFVRAKKTEKYKDVIAGFPQSLQKKIETGYGCYRKLGRTRCTGDCQGIRVPLDDSILKIGDDIKTWLDNEVKA